MVAEQFNTFFTTIVNKLSNPLGNFGKEHILNFYQNKGIKWDSFALSVVDEDKIRKMLSNIDKSKATGLDNLPARFASDAAEQMAPSIANIINISICQGILPNELKFARVIPIQKG